MKHEIILHYIYKLSPSITGSRMRIFQTGHSINAVQVNNGELFRKK